MTKDLKLDGLLRLRIMSMGEKFFREFCIKVDEMRDNDIAAGPDAEFAIREEIRVLAEIHDEW